MAPPVQVKKMTDEGSSSPFIARLFIGLLQLRGQLYLMGLQGQQRQDMQDRFDRKFKPVFEAAQGTRDAAVEALQLIARHLESVQQGRVIRLRANQYDILESIDVPLGQAVDKCIDQGVIATKGALQEVLRDPLGLEIGFLFQKDSHFNHGIADLQSSGEKGLAQYLCEVRKVWLAKLQVLRNQHEHEGWSLEPLEYRLVGPSQVSVILPRINSVPVDQYVRHTANRVLLFVENMMVYALQRNHQHPIFVAEIPRGQRNPLDAQRFRLAPRGLDPTQPWVIVYRDDMDFV